MKEKLEWLTLLVPGGVLAVLIVVSMLGNGPVLEDIPEKWKADNLVKVESPAPIETGKPDTKQMKKKDTKKEEIIALSYDGPKDGYKDGTYYGSATGYGGTIENFLKFQKRQLCGLGN